MAPYTVEKKTVTGSAFFPRGAGPAASERPDLLNVSLTGLATDGLEGKAQEVQCSKYVLSCHSLTLRERFEREPSLASIALPNLNGEAVATLYRFIADRSSLLLPWTSLEHTCEAVDFLQMTTVHDPLRQATRAMLDSLDRRSDYERRRNDKSRCQYEELLRDVMLLGHKYHLPGLVELGVAKSLSRVPESKQADLFAGMPSKVGVSVALKRHQLLGDQLIGQGVAFGVLFLACFAWLITLTLRMR